MMERIIELLNKANTILVAPMGWGKAAVDGPGQTTLGAKIAERLAKEGKRVGYIAPTLTLIDKKWGLLWSQLDVSIVATAGASQLCARGHKFYPQRYCHRCPLQRMPPEGFTPPAKLHYSELKDLPENVCPYWVQEFLMQRYDIVLGHYGRLRRFRDIDILIIDEIHEFVIPEIRQVDLADLRERYDDLDTSSVEALRESIEKLVIAHSDDEELWLLYDILLKMPIVWIEDDVLHGAQLRDLPRVRILGLTATPPPGWPPEGWEEVKIVSEKKPLAYIYTQYEWRYDELETIDASYHISQVLSFASRVGSRIAVFATSSRRQLLPEIVRQRYNADVFDAWGRHRVGVDLLDYDAVVVLWPTLHIEVRQYLRSQGRDPYHVEVINAVQLSGRIRPHRSHDDKIVIFAGARFARYWDYLSNFYELKEVKL